MTILPHARAALVDGQGRPTREFYDFFRRLAGDGSLSDTAIAAILADVKGIALKLGSPDGSVTKIPPQDADGAVINGGGSIQSAGSLASGAVNLTLVGDASFPGNTSYYGSNATGDKGWWPVAAALAVAPRLTVVVGADGVSTFDLADLANSGAGASLVKITRDQYGRVEGTQAATTDDLTEGATNLYHTPERVRDVMGTALVAGSNITITVNDPGDTITIAASGGGDIRDTWLMG